MNFQIKKRIECLRLANLFLSLPPLNYGEVAQVVRASDS